MRLKHGQWRGGFEKSLNWRSQTKSLLSDLPRVWLRLTRLLKIMSVLRVLKFARMLEDYVTLLRLIPETVSLKMRHR
eukprot:74781-Amphidinium_carterae.1